MFGAGRGISLTILQIQFFRQNRSKSVQNSKKKFIELFHILHMEILIGRGVSKKSQNFFENKKMTKNNQ